ncbi:MAG: M23 family metallopeptidase [bacterium]|nr:M23 family metallopeptidase [bacterium]
MSKKKKNIFIKIIGGSTILTIACGMIILICVLMIFDFFGGKLTKDKIQNNTEYADEYLRVVNLNLKNGYVPLQRLLYFSLEDNSLTFDTLYTMNQDIEMKTAKGINSVCIDERVKNMGACSADTLKENEEYLVVSSGHFNFPLDTSNYTVTSFFNEERIIYGENNIHNGWDLATSAQTPVYSVCSGTVYKVNYTQSENIPYDQSGNSKGNTITIRCDEDYNDIYYVVFAHLYPNSAKVKAGDKVGHWTQIASVGTTGTSTGNHLHYQVQDANWQLLDGMQFIDFKSTRTPSNEFNQFNGEAPFKR